MKEDKLEPGFWIGLVLVAILLWLTTKCEHQIQTLIQ